MQNQCTYLYIIKFKNIEKKSVYKIGVSWNPHLRLRTIKRKMNFIDAKIIFTKFYENHYLALNIEKKLCSIFKNHILCGKEFFTKLPLLNKRLLEIGVINEMV